MKSDEIKLQEQAEADNFQLMTLYARIERGDTTAADAVWLRQYLARLKNQHQRETILMLDKIANGTGGMVAEND